MTYQRSISTTCCDIPHMRRRGTRDARLNEVMLPPTQPFRAPDGHLSKLGRIDISMNPRVSNCAPLQRGSRRVRLVCYCVHPFWLFCR